MTISIRSPQISWSATTRFGPRFSTASTTDTPNDGRCFLEQPIRRRSGLLATVRHCGTCDIVTYDQSVAHQRDNPQRKPGKVARAGHADGSHP